MEESNILTPNEAQIQQIELFYEYQAKYRNLYSQMVDSINKLKSQNEILSEKLIQVDQLKVSAIEIEKQAEKKNK